MTIPKDKLAPIFRSLHPDESVITKVASTSAQEAAEKWPLFRVLAPKKPASTPVLSDADKQNWTSSNTEPILPSPPMATTSSLSDKLASGLSKMAGKKKPTATKPTKDLKTAEQPSLARAKLVPELPSRQVPEKPTAPAFPPAPEFTGRHETKPLTIERASPPSDVLKPVTPHEAISAPKTETIPTPNLIPDKPVKPKRIRKPTTPTKTQSEPVLRETPVQPLEITHETPESPLPATPSKTTGSLQSLLSKLQNPPNTTATSTVKTPAFLNRLNKK